MTKFSLLHHKPNFSLIAAPVLISIGLFTCFCEQPLEQIQQKSTFISIVRKKCFTPQRKKEWTKSRASSCFDSTDVVFDVIPIKLLEYVLKYY